MANDHYISKFLTAPWKADGCPLWHFNFATGKFDEKPSLDTIFAKRNLWSEDLEKFLGKHTENFSAAARDKIIGMKGEPDQREFESLFLLILFQAARTGYAKGFGKDLDKILSFNQTQLSQLISAAQENWSLCGVHLPGNLRLFFPDNGVFLFPVQTKTEFSWCFSLPMAGNFCLCLIPNQIEVQTLAKQLDYSHLVTWSVCSSKSCERILIHPDLYRFKKDEATLSGELLRMRAFVDQQIKAINEFNELISGLPQIIAKMFS